MVQIVVQQVLVAVDRKRQFRCLRVRYDHKCKKFTSFSSVQTDRQYGMIYSSMKGKWNNESRESKNDISFFRYRCRVAILVAMSHPFANIVIGPKQTVENRKV